MTTLIPARCHCGLNKFKIPFTTASLPRPALMCHCNTCRHSTGFMGYATARLDGPGVPLSMESTGENHIPALELANDLSSVTNQRKFGNLTVYRASSRAARYFCSTCSAHMFFRWDYGGGDRWCVMTGCLEQIDGVVTLTHHEFVGDTLDSGLADHLREVDGKVLKRFKEDEGGEELPVGWRAEGGMKNPGTLPLHCHCKSVQLYLTRAKKQAIQEKDIWIVPGKAHTDPIRWMPEHCLCNDCRLSSGQEVVSWIFVSDENIIDAAANAPVNLADPEKRPKALKQYMSSEGHYRYSCKTCGAAVFWRRVMREGETPHMDVAAGLIDEEATGGARAESWIAWETSEPGYTELARSKATATALKNGWRASTQSDT